MVESNFQEICIYGPVADEYSLARVNRGLAPALATHFKKSGIDRTIKVTASKDDVGLLPGEKEFSRYPGLAEIYEEFNPDKVYDLIVYNNFPKDHTSSYGLEKLPGGKKCVFIAWEEDSFPKDWIAEFNSQLDFVVGTSTHTVRVLKRSGLKIPAVVIPNGLDDQIITAQKKFSTKVITTDTSPAPLKPAEEYRFLHVSSGMERKSPRELLEAYTKAFTTEDNVCLVIKSFPNSNNLFKELIPEFTALENSPKIEFIDQGDLTEEELVALYQSCDCYLSPSKAEGFNLPVLEAMLNKLPTIVTGWGGHMDFCSNETNYLIDYELEPARSHLDNPGAHWAQIDSDELAELLRKVREQKGTSEQQNMIDLAFKTAANYTWENAAEKFSELINQLVDSDKLKSKAMAVISTKNTICGIAEYSNYLFAGIETQFKSFKYLANSDIDRLVAPDDDNVFRVWEYHEQSFDRIKDLLNQSHPDIVHIQYNLSFYPLSSLEKLIGLLTSFSDPVIRIILTAHAVQTPGMELGRIKGALGKIEQIHVLNELDQQYLEGLGLNNVTFFPHGNSIFPNQDKFHLRRKLGIAIDQPVIATHGFMIPGKGILETLESIRDLKIEYPGATLIALNAINPNNVDSAAFAAEFSRKITEWKLKNNVHLITDFLDREVILLGLSAADLVVFAYDEAKETASGAVRLALAANRPIIATNSSQLHDIQKLAYVIPKNSPQEISSAIRKLYIDPDLYLSSKQKLLDYSLSNSWDNLGLKYLKVCC